MVSSLKSYSVDTLHTTISGLSAGAYMAHQLHIAFSDIFCGAGLIAGGPYMTSQGSLFGALSHGLRGMPPPDYKLLGRLAENAARTGRIASLEGLKSSRVWVFHGTQDTVVKRSVADALVAFYSQFVDHAGITYIADLDVAHAMPTTGFGSEPTARAESPYIVKCAYDAAGALLQHLYPEHKLVTAGNALKGELIEFDQTQFLRNAPAYCMDTTGFAYLPSAALAGKQCRVHVALHGCKQHRGAIGDVFAKHAGYNAWAESNDLIVLYPQACAQSNLATYNPVASWDWWGYTNQDFAARSGKQMRAIANMVQHVSGLAMS